MTVLRVHEGDKEVYGFALYDAVTGLAITVDDVTAAEFVVVFGAVTLTVTYGSGITSAVVDGVLTVTVTLSVVLTEQIVTTEPVIKGSYQCRVTRGSIGPETVAEGTANGVAKIEGD